jgi:hypothetical protein
MKDVTYVGCSETVTYYVTRKEEPNSLEIPVFQTTDESEAKGVFELQKRLHRQSGVYLYKHVSATTQLDSHVSGKKWDEYLFGR